MSIQKRTYKKIRECKPSLKKLEVSISNPTLNPLTVNLFQFSITPVSGQYPLLNFSNEEDYDFLVQDLENNPIKAHKILFVSNSQEQLNNSVAVLTRDSDGTEDVYYQLPLTKVDTAQRQGNRVNVEFERLVLDGLTQFYEYQINPSTTITMVLYYKQLKRICLLDYPNLFEPKKPVTPQISKEIKDKICKREESFKKKDPEDICTKGKQVFSLTLTNTQPTPQPITLFDSGITQVTNTQSYGQGVPLEDFSTLLPTMSNIISVTYNPVDNTLIWFSTRGIGNNSVSTYNFTTGLYYENVYVSAVAIQINLALNTSTNDRVVGYESSGEMQEWLTPPNASPTLNNNFLLSVLLTRATTFYVESQDLYYVIPQFEPSVFEVDMLNLTDTPYPITALPFECNLAQASYSPNTETIFIPNYSSLIVYVFDVNDKGFTEIDLDGSVGFNLSVNGSTYNSKEDVIVVCTDDYAVKIDPNTNTIISVTFVPDSVSPKPMEQIVYFPTLDKYGTRNNDFIRDLTIINSDFQTQFQNFVITDPQPIFSQQQSFVDDRIFYGSRGLLGLAYLKFNLIDGQISFGDADSYNFFNQGLREDNKKVSCVKVVSSDQSQLVNNFDVLKIDANGKQRQEQISPIVKVDTFQQQGDRALIVTDDLILDGQTQFSQYTLNGNQTVNLLVYYTEVKRSSFITTKNKYVKPVKVKPIDWIALAEKFDRDKLMVVENCKDLQITITNSTGNDAPFSLFESFENQLVINEPTAIFGDIDAYNFIVQQLRTSPIILCGVEIQTTSQEQMNVPVIVSTDDANGDSVVYQHFPVNNIDIYQRQGNNVFIETNNLVLDGLTTLPNYIIKANTTVTFVIFYRQFMLSNFFNVGFFKVKRPIVENGKGFANEMEYFNEVSTVANNSIFPKKKLNKEKNNKKTEKNSIFDTEQSLSSGDSGIVPKSFDYLVPFYNKVKVKYQDTKGVCEIEKPKSQIIYVPTENLDFGNKKFYPKQKVSDNPLKGFSSEIRTVDDLSLYETQTRAFYDPNNEVGNRNKYRGFTKRNKRYRKMKLKNDKTNVRRNYRW